jgi:hypothetical protein
MHIDRHKATPLRHFIAIGIAEAPSDDNDNSSQKGPNQSLQVGSYGPLQCHDLVFCATNSSFVQPLIATRILYFFSFALTYLFSKTVSTGYSHHVFKIIGGQVECEAECIALSTQPGF